MQLPLADSITGLFSVNAESDLIQSAESGVRVPLGGEFQMPSAPPLLFEDVFDGEIMIPGLSSQDADSSVCDVEVTYEPAGEAVVETMPEHQLQPVPEHLPQVVWEAGFESSLGHVPSAEREGREVSKDVELASLDVEIGEQPDLPEEDSGARDAPVPYSLNATDMDSNSQDKPAAARAEFNPSTEPVDDAPKAAERVASQPSTDIPREMRRVGGSFEISDPVPTDSHSAPIVTEGAESATTTTASGDVKLTRLEDQARQPSHMTEFVKDVPAHAVEKPADFISKTREPVQEKVHHPKIGNELQFAGPDEKGIRHAEFEHDSVQGVRISAPETSLRSSRDAGPSQVDEFHPQMIVQGGTPSEAVSQSPIHSESATSQGAEIKIESRSELGQTLVDVSEQHGVASKHPQSQSDRKVEGPSIAASETADTLQTDAAVPMHGDTAETEELASKTKQLSLSEGQEMHPEGVPRPDSKSPISVSDATDGILETVTEPDFGNFGEREINSIEKPSRDAPIQSAGQAPKVELPTRIAMQIAETARHLPDRPIEITLSPEELGRVRLSFHLSDSGAVQVVIAAERPETMDLMRRNVESLAGEFRDLGYSGSGFTFESFDHSEQERPSHADNVQPEYLLEEETIASTPAPVRLSLGGNSRMDLRL
ncbi:flagellar hook-length control protein FliK [Celeribacter litoreus]|uniref:flagellar hook-length control protein FliK n=1 Tax=Celeribacter litoreus TaxID=2876714 RepID=UPI001CCEC4B7|nr:flagellar hook-length control protein FliK [Celeribacter litoreus]MCA0044250.1 flagellar hook-length control protein FliK [Celeribacter litoreus]